MLYLKRNTLNEIVYTASEFAGIESLDYKLKITNNQSLQQDQFNIVDISLTPDRFNLSNILLSQSIPELILNADYTIEENTIVIVNGDVTVNIGNVLTVNGTLLVTGSIITFGDGAVILGSEGVVETNLVLTGYELTTATLPDTLKLVDLPSGYYDYNILDINNTVSEIGKLLVEHIESISETYTPTNSTYVYNPE